MYPKLSPNNGYRCCPLDKLSHLRLEQLWWHLIWKEFFKIEGSALGESLGLESLTGVGSYTGFSGGSVEKKVEIYPGVSNKRCFRGAVMERGPLAMGPYDVVTLRVVMASGMLARGADAVVWAAVVVAMGYFPLRTGVRCSGANG